MILVMQYFTAERRNICLATCSMLRQSRSHITFQRDVSEPQNWTGRTIFDQPWAENWVDLCFARNAFRSSRLRVVCDMVSLKRTMWMQHISTLEVPQSYASLHNDVRQGPKLTQFSSTADGVIICGGIRNPGSPCIILWSKLLKYTWFIIIVLVHILNSVFKHEGTFE